MRFTNVKELLKNKGASLVSCKTSSETWDNFRLIKIGEIVHQDFAYCNECHASYKIHDAKGNSSILIMQLNPYSGLNELNKSYLLE